MRSLCAAAVLSAIGAMTQTATAELWYPSTLITGEKEVSDGKIEIASPGHPSAQINVNIQDGGALKISDTAGDAVITGRVDISGNGKLSQVNGSVIDDLTVGALILNGASLEINGNLTGQGTPYYVNVNEGSTLTIGGAIKGSFSAVNNASYLKVGSIEVNGNINTEDQAATTVTGGLLKGTNITNNGTISFTGNSATVKGTAPITGLGSWSAAGDLTFETRVDNGHRDQTTNANAALNVRGTLTINDALNNAGKVTAANIEGRGSITNWNGYNNVEDLVRIKADTIRLEGTLSNGQWQKPQLNAQVIADEIKVNDFKNYSGKTEVRQNLTAKNQLQVSGGVVSVGGILSAANFTTAEGSVVSFGDLNVTVAPENRNVTQAHNGWLKSGNSTLFYNAKFQMNEKGKLTNLEGDRLESLTVNSTAVFSKGAQVLVNNVTAQGLNNTANLEVTTLTMNQGSSGAGYLWNTDGATIKADTIEAHSVSNGPNTGTQDSTTITTTNLIVQGKFSNHTNNIGSKGQLTVTGGNFAVEELANAGTVQLENVRGSVGSVTAGKNKTPGAVDAEGVLGSIQIENSKVSVDKSSDFGDLSIVGSTIGLAAGQYSAKEFSSSDSTIVVSDIAGTRMTAEIKRGSLGLSAPGSENDKFASALVAADALSKVFQVNGEKAANTLVIEEGAVNNSLTATVGSDGTLIDVRETENKILADLGSLTMLGAFQWRHDMNDLTKRMGELRDSPQGIGTWARAYGSNQSYGGIEAKNTSIQVGADYDVGAGWKAGAAFTYTDSSSDVAGGSAESDAYGFAVYGTYLKDNGAFVDLIAKYSRLTTDFTIGEMSGSYDNNAWSVSVEAGHRFKLAEIAFVEPQVEVTYGSVIGDDFTAGNGVSVSQDDFTSLIGRAGARAGFCFPDNKGTVYARASVLHDFDGETETHASLGNARNTIRDDIGGTWVEYGVGANFNLTPATYGYVDLERTSGGEVRQQWRWNAGLRHVF